MSLLIVSLFLIMATCCIEGATRNRTLCDNLKPVNKSFVTFAGLCYAQRMLPTEKGTSDCLAYEIRKPFWGIKNMFVYDLIKGTNKYSTDRIKWHVLKRDAQVARVITTNSINDKVRTLIIYANSEGYVMIGCLQLHIEEYKPTMGILCTKEQHPTEAKVNSLLKGAKEKGFDPKDMVPVNQTNCPTIKLAPDPNYINRT